MNEKILIIEDEKNRIKQVFINILDNALKFTMQGGEIQISASFMEKGIEVIFKDTGSGIPEEDLPHITEKFYKGNTKKPGSGLGLAICEEIVKLHGGEIVVESGLGVGTMVKVTLAANWL